MIKEKKEQSNDNAGGKITDNLYVVLLASGFNNIARARSAFMFATLAAAAHLDTVVYCVQDWAGLMVKGVAEREEVAPGMPTLAQRIAEARAAGVRFQVCEQTAINKGIREEDLIEGAEIVGGMLLIHHALNCDGMLCF